MTCRSKPKRLVLPGLGHRYAAKMIENLSKDELKFHEDELDKFVSKRTLKNLDYDVAKILTRFESNSTLTLKERTISDNISTLSKLFELNDIDTELIRFYMTIDVERSFRELALGVFGHLDERDNEVLLCSILNASSLELEDSLRRLSTIGIVEKGDWMGDFSLQINSVLRRQILSARIHSKEQLLEPLLTQSQPAHFGLDDFTHLNATLISEYFESACQVKQGGTSLLLYGESGTGKTEFSRTLAEHLGKQLVEVRAHTVNRFSFTSEMEEKYSGANRLRYLQFIEYLLGSNSDSILLIDECESIFLGVDEHYTKERLHRFIEHCPVPSIWITNYIEALEPSFIRRFKLVSEVPKPPRSHLLEIVNDNGRGLKLSNDFKNTFIKTKNLSPAIITNACHVAQMIEAKGKPQKIRFRKLLLPHLTLQGYSTHPLTIRESYHSIKHCLISNKETTFYQ